MQVERRDSSIERKILTAMVVNSRVLSRIVPKWTEQGLFRSVWSNIVGGWCIEYFNKYAKAPNKSIEILFQKWAANARDDESVRLTEKFLSQIAGQYMSEKKKINSEHLIDEAGAYFEKIKVQRLATHLNDDIEADDLEKAHERIGTFHNIQLGLGNGITVGHDDASVKRAYGRAQMPLIRVPGALGQFISPSLLRSSYVAFWAKEKGCKSFVLMDLAVRGALQGQKVAYFVVGDMTEEDVIERLTQRLARWPVKDADRKWPYTVKIPRQFHREDSENPIEFEEKVYKQPLGSKRAIKAAHKLGDNMKLCCHPNYSINIPSIRSILDEWRRQEEFAPDILVLDYMDILAPVSSKFEKRDQIDENWAMLRGLGQSIHALVLTASQADAASYGKHTLDRSNFSNDKRKLAHVTSCIGINQTGPEQENGIVRYNYIVRRRGKFVTDHCVYVASCLDIGNPNVISSF